MINNEKKEIPKRWTWEKFQDSGIKYPNRFAMAEDAFKTNEPLLDYLEQENEKLNYKIDILENHDIMGSKEGVKILEAENEKLKAYNLFLLNQHKFLKDKLFEITSKFRKLNSEKSSN